MDKPRQSALPLGTMPFVPILRIAPFAICLITALASLIAYADTPLAPSSNYDVRSPSGKFFARVDPKFGVSVYSTGSTNGIWRLSKWFRQAFLADDGDHFISVHDNLIPKNFKNNLPLITFWNRDKKIRDVTVGELFPDTSALKSTVSHYNWGEVTGLTNMSLIVTRCDGKIARFNIATGEMLK